MRSHKFGLMAPMFVVAALGLITNLQATVVWNVQNDFSATNNPAGAWTYGYYSWVDTPSTWGAMTTAEHPWGISVLDSWTKVAGSGDPKVIHNPTTSNFTLGSGNPPVTPNMILWNADPAAAVDGVVRWTAPASGTFDVNAAASCWQTASGPDVVFGIYHNDTLLYQEVGPTHSYIASVTMAAGDHLDFANQYIGGHCPLASLGVTISGVPEPSTLAILSMGMFTFMAYAWRKRKCVPS
jgi:hypothetical protein